MWSRGWLIPRTDRIALAFFLAAFTLMGCSSSSDSHSEGERLLPDLVPLPSPIIQVGYPNGDASLALLQFTSTLMNVGEGDFLLNGVRDADSPDGWAVSQEISVVGRDPEVIPTDATMVWGGDGHDHWHVRRAATYWLVRLDAERHDVEGDIAGTDTKVGFCFFDTLHELDEQGPDEAIFLRDDCGEEDDVTFRMGLSPGWADEYIWTLPGQTIDITNLDDGRYRLWAEADDQAWFQEATRDNNVTWMDLEISTVQDGFRSARVIGVGPQPE